MPSEGWSTAALVTGIATGAAAGAAATFEPQCCGGATRMRVLRAGTRGNTAALAAAAAAAHAAARAASRACVVSFGHHCLWHAR